MTHPVPSDDLFRPSLDRSLDTSGWKAPFDPGSLVTAAFFGGPIAGGLLFGLNFTRMGRSKWFLPCLFGGVLVMAIHIAVTARGIEEATKLFRAEYAAAERGSNREAIGRSVAPKDQVTVAIAGRKFTLRTVHLAFQILTVLLCFPLARRQRKLVEAWTATGRPTAKVLGLALGVIAGTFVLTGAAYAIWLI